MNLLKECSHPLSESETLAIQFVDFVDLRVKAKDTWVTAIFVGGKIWIKEEDSHLFC